MQSPVRFSSCRGVAFEIKPHTDPFAIANETKDEPRSGSIRRLWPSWNQLNSSKVFPSSISKSMSLASSHYFDLDTDNYNDEDDVVLQKLEEGDHHNENSEKDHKPVIPSASKRQQGGARKPSGSRLSVILLDHVHRVQATLCSLLDSQHHWSGPCSHR